MKPEQIQVHNMLLDTIKLLCKNSLPFSKSLLIEGVIGITTDSSDVFLVHVNETLATYCSSSIVNQETSHETSLTSFGVTAAPVKRLHTVSTAPERQHNYIKVEEDLPPGDLSDFSYRKNAAIPSKNNPPSFDFDVPILQKFDATRRTYESEGSTKNSRTVVTQSFILGTNDNLQNEGVYYEETDQGEDGEVEEDYKTEETQEMWNTAYYSHHENHQEMFVTPPKASRCKKAKQATRGRGGGRSEARAGKIGRGHAAKAVSNMGEQISMSSGSESNQYVITQSTHVCGYPDCMKKFSFKKNLLYHQTKVHGRQPVKRSTPVKCSSSALIDDYSSGVIEGDCSNDASSGWNSMSAAESNQYVITQSTHVCGYPDCNKKFRFKKNLLHHQTKVHGRKPRKRNTPMMAACFSAFNEGYGTGTMEENYTSDNGMLADPYGYVPYE